MLVAFQLDIKNGVLIANQVKNFGESGNQTPLIFRSGPFGVFQIKPGAYARRANDVSGKFAGHARPLSRPNEVGVMDYNGPAISRQPYIKFDSVRALFQ